MNYQNISLQPIDDISRFADSIYAIEENNIREKKKMREIRMKLNY